MKRNFYFFGLVLIVLLAGCSAANSPSAVVRKYYEALEKNDIKALAKVTTPESLQNISQFGTKAQNHVIALGKILTITEEIDGDAAVVTVTFENDEESIEVKKVDGKWKVSEWDSLGF